MIDSMPAIRRLHDAYCCASGRPHTLTMSATFLWERFIAHGWTEEDLKLVVALVRAKIKAGQKWTSALGFQNLIVNEDNFNELLAEARSLARRPKPTPFGRVLHQTGQSARPGPDTAKPAGDVIKGNQALMELLKLRDSL